MNLGLTDILFHPNLGLTQQSHKKDYKQQVDDILHEPVFPVDTVNI